MQTRAEVVCYKVRMRREFSAGGVVVRRPRDRRVVAATAWLPLDEAPTLLAYKGKREMAARALDRLGSGG